MNIFKELAAIVDAALKDMAASGELPGGLDFGAVSVEPPRDAGHGDVATNAALLLAKQAKSNPREIAEKLSVRLAGVAEVEAAEVAGPGFVNLRLSPAYLRDNLREVLRAGTAYGDSKAGDGVHVNVEYVSANPTGPLHMGHCRGAVFGDALANLLAKAGYTVCTEYYINDAGGQIDQLARSLHFRYREALGEEMPEFPEDLYPGDYLVEAGRKLAERDGDKWREAPESEWLGPIRAFACEAMLEIIRGDLGALGIEQDVFFSESSLYDSGAIDHAIETLEGRDLIYEGVLEPPKGKVDEDWEPRPQALFRATKYGDDVDRPLRKSDGGFTYFASDIAYHLNKFERGFTELIDVWGADHGGYVKRMKAAVEAITEGGARLDVKLCQMVKLFREGTPVRMSKRAGQFVSLRDVVDEVGRDVVRFIMLTRKNDAQLEFDFAKVMEQSKDNPVFYVQYAHARVCSVIRNARQELPDLDCSDAALSKTNLDPLDRPDEMTLIRHVLEWPRLVEGAAESHEPHRVAFFLYDLANAFHVLWNKGNEDQTARFIQAGDKDLTLARLALVRSVALVIASGLKIMGVEPLEEMR